MKISTLFIIDEVLFTDEQNAQFKALYADWNVINIKNGRMIVDALIEEANFDTAQAALAAYNPNVIGKWNRKGELLKKQVIDNSDPNNLVYTSAPELYDVTEYIALLPPIITIDENENITETPRTEAVEIHKFGGWGDRQWA